MADIKLDTANVPPELHPLIPYAEKWGIRDEKRRAVMLREAPLSEIEALCEAVYPLWDSVDQFTILRPDFEEPPSFEVEVFSNFREGNGAAFSILSDKNPSRVLEIIGFPEACPAMKFDHANVPPELEYLTPYAEKWVIDDQGVRDTFVRAATNAEIEDLLSAINQIGETRIRMLILPMMDGELFNDAGYVFALLLEVAFYAEDQLKQRTK